MFKVTIRLSAALGLGTLLVAAAMAQETLRGVGFGDSLMAGYQLGPDEGFPEKLEAALRDKGYAVEIANAGVSGDTTSAGLARLDWSVPDGTDFVILELGANDALRGITPDITRENLDAMLARLDERGIDVILAGMLAPPNMGDDYAEAFNTIYPDLAEKYDVTLYPFFLDGVSTVPGMTLSDGMHPSAEGVETMVDNFLPLMEDYIEKRSDSNTVGQ